MRLLGLSERLWTMRGCFRIFGRRQPPEAPFRRVEYVVQSGADFEESFRFLHAAETCAGRIHESGRRVAVFEYYKRLVSKYD